VARRPLGRGDGRLKPGPVGSRRVSGGEFGLGSTVGIITRKYPQRNLHAASSLAREAYCFAEAVIAFQPFIFNSDFVYVTDSQALARLWSADRISHIPFISRQLFRVSSTIDQSRCRVVWVPRDSPALRNVDALGR
jgi:hypothetical protein